MWCVPTSLPQSLKVLWLLEALSKLVSFWNIQSNNHHPGRREACGTVRYCSTVYYSGSGNALRSSLALWACVVFRGRWAQQICTKAAYATYASFQRGSSSRSCLVFLWLFCRRLFLQFCGQEMRTIFFKREIEEAHAVLYLLSSERRSSIFVVVGMILYDALHSEFVQ